MEHEPRLKANLAVAGVRWLDTAFGHEARLGPIFVAEQPGRDGRGHGAASSRSFGRVRTLETIAGGAKAESSLRTPPQGRGCYFFGLD